MNEEELQQWILRRLGAPFLKVELTADALADAVEVARRWFAAKKGVKRQVSVAFYAGLHEYALDDQVDTVLDVAFPVNPMDISMVFSPYILQDEKVPYDTFAASGGSGGLYSSYTQAVQYVEMAKRVLGAEPDWRQEGRSLLIFPIPRSNGYMRLDYKSHDFTIEQLDERDHDLVKRMALASAKLDVGRIRSKYGEFAGAQGATQLDGQALLAEGTAEVEALNKEIAMSGYPMAFMAG